MALKTILSTPDDIQNACLPYFPDAKVKVELSESFDWCITLRLSNKVAPITLSTAIETKPFIEELDFIRKISDLMQSKIQALKSPANFSTLSPLKECQLFNRAKFIQKGRSYIQVISNFLNKPDDPKNKYDLGRLGLAPEQIGPDLSEEDFSYFQQVALASLELQDRETKTRWTTSFEKYYPQIFKRLVQEELQRNLQHENPVVQQYQRICQEIQTRVIGQPTAVKAVAHVLVGAQDNSANGSFLFVGPSGVGKTELAKTIVKLNRLIALNMETYNDHTAASTLFGSSAGYVGSTDKPLLAKEFDRCGAKLALTEESKETYIVENTVILFDEFEKAHSDVKQSFLTLFDIFECQVTYTKDKINKTLVYKLENSFVIATSNLFQDDILRAFQHSLKIEDIQELFKKLNKDPLKKNTYSPELLGRVEIIPFGPIAKGEDGFQRIIQLNLVPYLESLKEKFRFRSVEIEDEKFFLQTSEDILYGQGTDLRKLRRDYCKKFGDCISNNGSKWGQPDLVKVVLFAQKNNLYLKAMSFIRLKEDFETIPGVFKIY